MNDIILAHLNGLVTVDSLMIASHFGKQHGHVLRDIEELKKDVSNFGEMFFESEYLDSYGRSQRNYFMTRDGFTLLAMGFTGQKALAWKLKYIAAFNELEKAATKPMSHLEILAESAKALVDHDRRLSLVEKKQDVVIEALTAPVIDDWEAQIKNKVLTIIKHRGYVCQTYWQELYIKLESTARVDLSARKNNKIKRMKDAGCKSKEYNAVSKLSIIASDPQLKAIFEDIVRMETARLAVESIGGESA
jgi:Rha family phage regulatory protein